MRKIRIALGLALAAASTAGAAVSRDAGGWTVVTPSSHSRIIYVDATGGSDASTTTYVYGADVQGNWDPLLPPPTVKALKTVSAAEGKLRDGFPDWILFKKGEKWGSIGWRDRSGQSAAAPILIGAYGVGARPEFTGTLNFDGGVAHSSIDHVYFTGLNFYHESGDPATAPSPSATESKWGQGATDILIEDCVFRFNQLSIQDNDHMGISDMRLRRNQFLDNYNANAHAQGIYVDGVDGLLIEENVFDHNGWNDGVPGADKVIFNHNAYINGHTKNTTTRGNIFLRASSHGIQMRGDGDVAQDNFFAYNAIGLLFGGGDNGNSAPTGVTGVGLDNVILCGSSIGTDPKGLGVGLENITAASFSGNVIAHSLRADSNSAIDDKTNQPYYAMHPPYNITYGVNVVYDWPKGAHLTGSYPDPNRTLETYARDVLGLPGSTDAEYLDSYVSQLRLQSKDNWRAEYTAKAVNTYIRQGFGLTAAGADTLAPARPKGLRAR